MSGARGQEREAAAARTEPVGYSSPVGARRRAPARRLREGETAPGERRQRGLAVGHDEAREHDEPRRGPSKTSLSSRPWRARAVVTAWAGKEKRPRAVVRCVATSPCVVEAKGGDGSHRSVGSRGEQARQGCCIKFGRALLINREGLGAKRVVWCD